MSVELNTERLTMRQWCLDDFEPLAAFLADAELNRYRMLIADRIVAWNYFCGHVGQWALRGFGAFAIVRRDDNQVVGYTGLWMPIDLEEPELFWSLYRGTHGNGYATEAAARVQAWAHNDLKFGALMSFVHADNKASRAVAERLGATVEDQTEFRGNPRLRYRHTLSPTTH